MNPAIRILPILALLLTVAPLQGDYININTRSSVPLKQTINDALKVAQRNPSWVVMLGDDISMDPYYGSGSVLLIDRASYESLRPDMIVVYRDSEGDLVGHWLIQLDADGWVTQGINNLQPDAEKLDRRNYVGVVFGVLNSRGVDAEGISYARSLGLEFVRGKSR